ncbi:hypothetical protein L226DRAFT_617846 [Lentinus tigrinus ALCF2SS1-7]|uniref:SH3 domain-containing protein n=1 Tax=Lentinus tigrinus ALCF2SS1-6 TaxID=1328759 RepID=A0A5C2RVA8_9APHY|nr:hypothetical protein L227DRAFT_604066 [Lentinus tigrinus ALCF2SS1-6]RPD67829.1 hypothetical protein L226DRAFT_617846 [Lentinus tigrinus ALCF2SS1-7]
MSDDLLQHQLHADHAYPSDEEHSVLEDDSDGEDRDLDYMDDDDGSSSLSIPNESIDFDLVYALHSFAATVEGQANVVKGDSLFLMDDSNSYWWLVRVLKTQEVGYIPAENIETPFERLARLNKHRNVDLASATQAELQESRDRLLSSRAGSNQPHTPSPTPGHHPVPQQQQQQQQSRGVRFRYAFGVHRYAPAIWNDEEEEDEDIEWDDEDYEDEDPELAEEWEERERTVRLDQPTPHAMEPDDGMSWEDGAAEEMQRDRQQQRQPAQIQIDDLSRHPDQLSPQNPVQPLRTQQPRDKLIVMQDEPSPISPSSPSRTLDPAQVTETRKLTMTPPVARSDDHSTSAAQAGPLLPSAIMQQQSEERKRTREEIEALEEAARKKANISPGPGGAPRTKVTSTVTVGDPNASAKSGGKLRKDRDRGQDTTDDESGKEKDKKKKSGGVFGGLFGRKKDKTKDKSDTGSAASTESLTRESEESGRSTRASPLTSPEGGGSPVTVNARQQQQQAMLMQQQKNSTDPRRSLQQQAVSPQQTDAQSPPAQAPAPQGPNPSAVQAQISQHASTLRQRDQQQQALYQQYLNRSPATPPEAQPSYGLQSASAVLQGSMSFTSSTSSTSGLSAGAPRPRPGSLVLSPTAMDGQGVGLPDLSVVRVFAGDHLQTEATFKTVLLNNSTTASDLVRQAIQRFRLPAGEDENDYYLTIKQVEGSSAVLRPEEKPLGVFESLVEAAMEIPKVKRSSVGSISSVASNLSMHPAIKKLSMNDFTDDSQVKFYLNRRGRADDSLTEDGDETLLAESIDGDGESRGRGHFLSVSTAGGNTVTPERFSSPSFRFGLQLVIYPDDLPDDMVFDPQTEAIVFKNTLRNRPQASQVSSPGISQTMRKKIFVFPKNITVAEVIEQGLDRFGIPEGVVDGGDEVEDKQTKRRSSTRVRYSLAVEINGKERELWPPSTKVIEAFPRPPTYRQVERRFSDSKRRSIDSAQLLLGSIDDVRPDDPVFILRRAVSYRTSSSRHRSSAPLDELALQQLRESVASSSTASDTTERDEPKRQLSKQEIIAAQRAATRANQRAILSAQANSARGLDVLLPGNAMLRSSRYEVDDKIRYSYVEPDGETYDISDIVEEEWRGVVGPTGHKSNLSGDDLLHGVLAHGKDGLGAKLDRVLSKIRHEKETGRAPLSQSSSGQTVDSVRSSTDSAYSANESSPDTSTSRTATPVARDAGRNVSSPGHGQRVGSPTAVSRLSSYRTASPGESDHSHSRSHTATPTASRRGYPLPHERQSSFASAMSDYRTATPSSPRPPTATMPSAHGHREDNKPKLVLPKNDFGLNEMMAVIEMRAALHNKIPEHEPLDPVEEMLFGRPIDPQALHPEIRNIYASTFTQLEEMDQILDELLQQAIHVH